MTRHNRHRRGRYGRTTPKKQMPDRVRRNIELAGLQHAGLIKSVANHHDPDKIRHLRIWRGDMEVLRSKTVRFPIRAYSVLAPGEGEDRPFAGGQVSAFEYDTNDESSNECNNH